MVISILNQNHFYLLLVDDDLIDEASELEGIEYCASTDSNIQN